MPISLSSEDFERDVQEMVKGGSSYIEAVTEWCARQKVEPEVGAELVQQHPEIQMRLQMEAETLALVKHR